MNLWEFQFFYHGVVAHDLCGVFRIAASVIATECSGVATFHFDKAVAEDLHPSEDVVFYIKVVGSPEFLLVVEKQGLSQAHV